MTAYENVIASRSHGKKRIMGTLWGIESFVRRDGPRDWVLTVGLCNGVPKYTESYKTRREALEALDDLDVGNE